MFGLGVSEIVIIGIVALMLLFGSKKVVEIARSLGRVGGEFKKGQQEIEAELKASALEEGQATTAENKSELANATTKKESS